MKSVRIIPTVSICMLAFMLVIAGCASSSTSKNESASNPKNESAVSSSKAKYPAAIQEILEAGKKEGKVTYFGITTDPGAVKKFESALEKFYGFPIKVNMISGLHPQKSAEVIAASKSGVKPDIDIFHSATNTLVTLDKANLFADVKWSKDFGLDASYDMLGGKVLRLADRFLANVVYNTNLVPKEQAPKSYDELLDSKWKGKMIMPRSSSPFAYIAGAMGEEYADKLVKGIANQNVTVTAKFPDVNARVGAGEFALGIGIESERDAKRGAPMTNTPIEPVIITPWGNALMKDAANPNAAKLMTYFLITPEGQKMMDELWSVSLSNVQGTASSQFVQGKKTLFLSDDFVINKFELLREKYAGLLNMK